MLQYDLGEMRNVEGSVIYYDTEKKTFENIFRIFSFIKTTHIYKTIRLRVTSDRVPLYFLFFLRRELYPYVLEASAIQWHIENGAGLASRDREVLAPKSALHYALKEVWDFEGIPLKLTSPLSLRGICNPLVRGAFEKGVRNDIKRYLKYGSPPARFCLSTRISEKGIVACNYNEGIDYSKRCDLGWYPGSGICPRDILLYFDESSLSKEKAISKETIGQIESQGFNWVALKRGIIEGRDDRYWSAPPISRSSLLKKNLAKDLFERLAVDIGNRMLHQIHYWKSFHRRFNVKVHYFPGEALDRNIAQAIALDIDEIQPGVLVGRQRSELYLPSIFSLGFHPKHVFFTWSRRAERHLRPNYNCFERVIVTGYTQNIPSKFENRIETVRSKGGTLIIALFDSIAGPQSEFSTQGMTKFYLSFLNWVIDDAEVGLIIKPKKSQCFQKLYSIQPLLQKAIDTSRCILIEDSWGKFPSEASVGADMAVGVGFSSAAMEAVIGGCRGIHYDMVRLRDHEFYRWGYEEIIFDDLERMIAALKRYKNDPQKEPRLGNWSEYMNDVDPFCDGKGSQRMGTYMRWLLEKLNDGMDRDGAIAYADKQFAERWGKDKIIDMEKKSESSDELSAAVRV